MPKRVYLNRTLTKEIEDISDNFKALLVTGPRQIGKTTLLKQIADTNRKYVSLDTKSDLLLAKSDPQGFLDLYQPPVLIDEIQYAPELFPYIKLFLDNADEKGLIWMTGSQQYNMMKNVTESLAGRIAIVNMLGLSLYEIEGIGEQQLPFKPSDNTMIRNILTKKGSTETFEIIWRGSFPEIIAKSPKRVKNFYESYVRTYIERDVRQLINLEKELSFFIFLKVLAARTGQILNYGDIARNVGVTPATIKGWISILQASGLIYLLQPYFKNITKRLTKAPKLYFLDTGLAAYLAGWTTAEALQFGTSSGAFFETFVVSEIIKSYYHSSETPQIYYFRDEKGHEIDLLICENQQFYPIEIKQHATPMLKDVSAFKILSKYETLAPGCEICLTPKVQPLCKNINAISIWNI